MINKDSFKSLLEALGFKEENEVYTKYIDEFELKADFNKEELIYPNELKINEKQTCNFSAYENYVVFECVHRLIEKGYQPKNIELEPKWRVGHGASGGRADIWVKDNHGNSLLIIECKTAGKEYDNAWKDTMENGGQLFSYFQQEKSTQFLALYASDFADNEIKFEYKLITVLDNEEYLKSFGKREVPSYKNADTVGKIYLAWANTYQKDFATKGLFENDITAYHIGKRKYSVADLKEVDNDSIQKKYHEFATILRQHNVAGHENAFDKLVNLFLAKIVDEKNNKSELAFYWKGAAFDDVKSLIDRLQKHYKIGMEKFLKEDVTYIEKKQIESAFKLFKNKPDATKTKILEYFDQLKYYTNNDFAFIDVHNEKLFYQNSIVLLKIVQMLQDIKLKTETQNQFLGDLFEGFLDKGVKQSEGQFFTPMPIVKFLISSLPLEKLIIENPEIPKVIDYACGAGHFLNEYAHQITSLVNSENRADYFKKIVGIEKEYRLSKVAKVSAFMYGQDNIEIIHSDALANNSNIKDASFSLLVANPPYSVKGFLETLDDECLKQFELFKSIEDKQKKTNNSIECFFIERAKQLLAPNGIAAIILPSSILNKGGIYTKTREIILKYFDIIAIVELGKITFGKTGIETATLFLRRKDNNPDIAEHYKIRVNTWFNKDSTFDKLFEDKNYIEHYCDAIGIELSDYETLISGNPNKDLYETDIFTEYRTTYQSSTEFKNIKKKKITDKYSKMDKEMEIEKTFLEYVQTIEKDKLYYFMLAESNNNLVCLVKSPADNENLKRFLGYSWSERRGSEGIKYPNYQTEEEEVVNINKGIKNIVTPMFNPNNLNDVSKINTLIKSNFTKQEVENTQPDFVSFVKLSDLIDFTRVNFEKTINTTAENKIEIKSSFDLKSVKEITALIDSGSRPKGGVGNLTEGAYSLGGQHIHNTNGTLNLNKPKYVTNNFYMTASKGKIKKGDLLICKDGALTGKVAIVRDELNNKNSMVNEHLYILRCENQFIQKYLFIFFFSEIGQYLLKINRTGAGQGGLNSTNLKNIKIPMPSIDVLVNVINDFDTIETEYNTSRMSIKDYKNKIAELFTKYEIVI